MSKEIPQYSVVYISESGEFEQADLAHSNHELYVVISSTYTLTTAWRSTRTVARCSDETITPQTPLTLSSSNPGTFTAQTSPDQPIVAYALSGPIRKVEGSNNESIIEAATI